LISLLPIGWGALSLGSARIVRNRIWRTPLICILAIASCTGIVQAAAQGLASQNNTEPRSAYESWISAYQSGLLGGALADNNHIKLRITVVESDNPKANETPASGFGPSRTFWDISTEGTVSFTRVTPMAIQGGGPGLLPADDFLRLQALITSLPGDHSQLPPQGRRILLQVVQGTKTLARVYDRANMPDKVLEILRLTGTGIKPVVLDFAPDKKWWLNEFNDAGISANAIGIRTPEDSVTLAVSPDRSLIVQRFLFVGPRTQITDLKKSTVLRQISDGEIDRRIIYTSHAWFTPDGRYLLLLSNLPAIHIYDTKTWEQWDALPGLPSGEVAYYPSSCWSNGVTVSATGEVDLWDAIARRKLTTLDLDGTIQSVSFSPDDSLFAVTSIRHNKDLSSTFHLRVWETKSGKFVHELMPLENLGRDEIGDPMWWGKGRYLLAAGQYGIGIWNVATGRYRGGFLGCASSDDPFAILLEGQRLFKRCQNGMLLEWDVPVAIDKITEFENTLEQLPADTAKALSP
jgi:WD40 repeat protein